MNQASKKEKLLLRITPFILPVSILIVWQSTATFEWLPKEYLRNISSPSAILSAGWKITKSGELFGHLWASTRRALSGLFIGGVLGLFFGIISGISKWGEALLDSTLQMIRNIPHLALIPLVILWFGVEESGKIFLVTLGTFFPIYLNTYHGIRTIDSSLIEMAKSYGLSGFKLFRHVLLPGALPGILVGLRFSLGIMWLTLIVAETISSSSGIGYLSMNAREFLQVDMVIFTILIYALLGIAADYIAKKMEYHFLQWNPTFQKIKKT